MGETVFNHLESADHVDAEIGARISAGEPDRGLTGNVTYEFRTAGKRLFQRGVVAHVTVDENGGTSDPRVFATGDATLPSKGMEEIPRQIADSLGPDKIQFQSKAIKVSDGSVTLEDGRIILGKQIVVATPEPVLQDLLDIKTVNRSVGESCLYYSTDWVPPFKEPFLLLNGDGYGPVNNIAFPSMIAKEYAPAGKTLIAVVVVDDQFIKRTDLEGEVRSQCREWFGDIVNKWEHLRTYQIEHALPDQSPPTQNPYLLPKPISENIRICGEYQSLPGLQWALMSGHMTGKNITKTV